MIIPIWTKGKKGIVSGIFIALMGIFVIVMAFLSGGKDTVNPNNYQYEAMETGKIYDLGECYILDSYAKVTSSDSADEHYYIAANVNGDVMYVFSLKVSEKDDVYDEIQAYMDDDTLGFGDLKMPIVARASKMADESDEQYTFYKDAISNVESVYDCTSVEAIQFTYLFDTADGIDAYNKSQRSGSIFMGIIGLAFTALGVFLVLRNTGVLMAKAPAGGQTNAPYNPQQVPQQAPYTPYQQTQIPQQTPYQPTQMPQQPQQYPQQTQTPQQPPYAQSGNFAQPPYPQPGTYEQPQNPNGNNNGVL